MTPRIITIDGPAGSGKSTVAKAIAAQLGWVYVTTGAIYRAFALLQHENSATTPAPLQDIVRNLEQNYRQDPFTGRQFIGEWDVTDRLFNQTIASQASLCAKDPLVRQALLPLQRTLVEHMPGSVVDGRDMGTVVFPNAPLKIFLTASVEERARRRWEELRHKHPDLDYNTIKSEVADRDWRDENRSVAPLKPAPDALVIDSTNLTSQAVEQKILALAVERGLAP